MVTRETERNRKWCKGARGGELEGDQRKTFWLHRMKELLPHSVSSVLYRKLAEEKYEEVHARRRELRSRHFEKVSVDVLNESREGGACQNQAQPISSQNRQNAGGSSPKPEQDESEPELHDIPEDPRAAEVYYNQDRFDSCSEDDEPAAPAETLYLSDPQEA
ncbi:serine/threonine-protein kinase Nek11-like [Neolamprologus brichardi]|uniref:serine/threonine-protein kinase Nek11-like n=1 Tax=Neolamprologus brichardi TaxID=32507 RepID=UPI001643E501|nr:serine/threonine-protein kinase Nek11-like [Neolamprologus brichardi]